MRNYLPQEIADAVQGKIITWHEGRKVGSFIRHTKEPEPNCLYILFKRPEDEDILLSNLIKQKAAGIIIRGPHRLSLRKWTKAGIGVIEVKNVIKAYYRLAKLHRSRFGIPVVQVIGSAGKTTTKEMIGSVIREKMPVLISYKNANAPFDVARTVHKLNDSHRAAVIEVGMKALGTMRASSKIVQPTIGVITGIQRAHLSRMGSMEKIIEAKSELLECLPDDGTLIVNWDNENCRKLPLKKFKGEVIKFGFSNEYDIWASDIRYEDFKTSFKANIGKLKIDCRINTFGRYNVANALAAIMVGLKLGMSTDEIKTGLSKFEPVEGRLKLHKGIRDTILIHDNFNANPDSTKLLLKELPYFPEERPIILVMGDMENPRDDNEEYSRKVHFDIGKQIARSRFDHLIAIGKWAEEYVKGAAGNGVPAHKLSYFKTVRAAKSKILDYAVPGSVILFKAQVMYVKLRQLINILKEG